MNATIANVDLKALFVRAMDTETMRNALGDAHSHVLNTTAIKVIRKRSARNYGSCLGWWMRTAAIQARENKYSWGARDSMTTYRPQGKSTITMNTTTLAGSLSRRSP